MAYEFYLGVDTSEAPRGAMALVEKTTTDDLPRYALRAAETFDDGRSDEDRAARVQNVIAAEPFTGHTLVVVNRTGGPGGTMTDLLVGEGLSPVGVTLTPGDGAGQADTGIVGTGRKRDDQAGFNVSAHTLYTSLRGLYESGQLNLADLDLPEVSAMLDGLHNEDEAAGEAAVIDANPLIRSIALACWYGERRSMDPTENLEGDVPPTGRPNPAVNLSDTYSE